MPFLTDVKCDVCGNIWEELLTNKSETTSPCPKCQNTDTYKTYVGGHITKLNSQEALTAELKRRSAEHTLKGIRKIAGHRGSLPANLGQKGCQID